MKRYVLFSLLILFISSAGFSQSFGDIYAKSITDNSAIPYSFLREADVIWSKRLTRMVDLREKMNLPLYYPTTTTPDGRMSLVSVILGELKSGSINAYDTDNMTASVTYTDIERAMGAMSDTTQVQLMTGELKDTVIYNPPRPEEIRQLLVLEEWYFDKKHSKMDVRIIGLCPIRVFFDDEMNRISRRQLFWIKYEDFRDAFAQHESYNRFNDAQRISFDDLFIQRRFSSTIYAESNVYNDRLLNQYKLGKDVLYEAERIKNELMDFEHDLWEY
jgi:gliding motility associated protien GldN